MIEYITTWATGIGLMLLVIIVAIIFVRFLFRYKISEEFLEIYLFRIIPLLKIPYGDIKEIYQPTLVESASNFAWHCENKFHYKRIVIKRTKGMFPNVFITPDNPMEFIEKIKQNMNKV